MRSLMANKLWMANTTWLGPRLFISGAATVTILCLFYFSQLNFSHPDYHSLGISLLVAEKDTHVAIVETRGVHDEVTASYVSAFGQLPNYKTRLFLEGHRFGIDEVYERLPGGENRELIARGEFRPHFWEEKHEPNPDVVVAISAEVDILDNENRPAFDHLLVNTDAQLLITVHHADEWKNKGRIAFLSLWARVKRVRFITLSHHVGDYMRDNIMNKWPEHMRDIPMENMAPVFPYPGPPSKKTMPEQDTLQFAMQGDLIVNRKPNRDWNGTFESFAEIEGENADKSNNKAIELHVLGRGDLPPVPESAKDKIVFHTELPYLEFYETLHQAEAILPAFATESYTKSKASSTIPAAMVVGVPIIADKALLDAYRYLDEEDVYLAHEGENEINVVERIAKLPEAERRAKSARVVKKNEELTKQAARQVREWTSAR